MISLVYDKFNFDFEFLGYDYSGIKHNNVIVLDDFCSFEDDSEYNLWKHGEFKAVQEWLLETNRDIKFLSRTKVGAVGIEVIK